MSEECLATAGDLNHTHPKAQGLCWERKQKEGRSQNSGRSILTLYSGCTGLSDSEAHSRCGCLLKNCKDQARQHSNMERRGVHEFLPHPKVLLTADGFRRGRDSFIRVCLVLGQLCSVDSPGPRSIWLVDIGLCGFFKK